jgi:hypothetical protein
MLGAGPIALAFPIEKVFRFSKTSKALAYGAQEAEHDRQHMIESDHLLRGVLLTEEPFVAQLSGAGYSLATTQEASQQAYSCGCVSLGISMNLHQVCEAGRSLRNLTARTLHPSPLI